MNPILAVVLVLIVVAVLFLVTYNGIIGIRQLSMNAWADVDVYLKRRADLIPNLVATVKAFATHEQAVLTSVVEARNMAQGIQQPTADKSRLETDLGAQVGRVMLLAESYPELTSSQNFLNLQTELRDTEKLLANARQYFNACVRDYNTKLEAFPSNLVAGVMGAKPMDYFQLENAAESVAPRV